MLKMVVATGTDTGVMKVVINIKASLEEVITTTIRIATTSIRTITTTAMREMTGLYILNQTSAPYRVSSNSKLFKGKINRDNDLTTTSKRLALPTRSTLTSSKTKTTKFSSKSIRLNLGLWKNTNLQSDIKSGRSNVQVHKNSPKISSKIITLQQ
jgi:hypothetical protein